ncbi:uncharacterized protein LOC125038172 isoform X4 [Penaeus chinensis]|uniref:uncharacterized protein LOC125038172 isoform X4 n=1 Tax=Penaeus chinensis TaxID=139456 RepID=UPI001FB60F0F|nr:uncharacterized protein LOC125038172 isoform X4 [Penaeus chinensis]
MQTAGCCQTTMMAAHTPKRLEIQALESFVFMVLRSTSLPFMKLPLPLIDRDIGDARPILLDAIILDIDTEAEKRKLMMEHLLKLKKWWERNEWLGSQDTEIRKQIKECFTRELELVDPVCEFPLFRFVLQLIFSKKAGSTADAAECPDYPMSMNLVFDFQFNSILGFQISQHGGHAVFSCPYANSM